MLEYSPMAVLHLTHQFKWEIQQYKFPPAIVSSLLHNSPRLWNLHWVIQMSGPSKWIYSKIQDFKTITSSIFNHLFHLIWARDQVLHLKIIYPSSKIQHTACVLNSCNRLEEPFKVILNSQKSQTPCLTTIRKEQLWEPNLIHNNINKACLKGQTHPRSFDLRC